MAKNRTKLESNFPAAKKAAWENVQVARKMALDAGEAEAEKKLERIDDSRGYELPINIEQEYLGHQSGRIYYEPWWGRLFEYGTVRIPAAPFMRPAHRRMRKVFLGEMEGLEKFISRRAKVRK